MDRRVILKSVAAAGLAAGRQVSAADAKLRGQDAGNPQKEVVVIVSIHVKPGSEAEFLRLLMPVLDAMRHETTFINAILHQDPADPTRFMVYETWADRDDLANVQIHRDYRKDYLARLPDLTREPRRIELWQKLRGDFTFFAA